MSRSKPVLPYRILPAELIRPSEDGWTVLVNGAATAQLRDGSAFSAWDAKLAFRLERTFRIESDLGEALKVDSTGSCCELVVTAATSSGLSREVLYREEIPAGSWSDRAVSIAPKSERLARDLVLTSGIYLSRDVRSRDPLAPQLRGSRLWEMTERIRLEGGAARLPMYEVAFSKAFIGDRIDKAEFHIELSDDPELEVESALTVYLNSECPEFVQEVSRAGSAAERRLWNGIMRRVLTSVILSDEHLSSAQGEAATLASTVVRWAQHIWPGVPPQKLRDLPSAGYSRFEAQIESWLTGFEAPRGGGGSS